MTRVILTRKETGDEGTFGVLTVKGVSFFSGELPWRDNASNISSIPSGLYRCVWSFSPRFKRFMYLVKEVDERAGIRIHSANLMGDSKLGFRAQLNGCVAIGEKLGHIGGQKALLLSRPAVRRFETLLNRQDFDLEIQDV